MRNLTREQVLKILSDNGVNLEKEKVAQLAIRHTEGGKAKVGVFDDTIIWIDQYDMATYEGNVDPSKYKKDVATLKPGVWRYRKGNHNSAVHGSYPAYRQAAPVKVLRWQPDGTFIEKPLASSINEHHGSTNNKGTSSLGCLTIRYSNWPAFKAQGDRMIDRAGVSNFPLCLTLSTAPVSTSLKKGDRGERVKEAQTLLGITADGIFGLNTEKAVIAFQKKNGLVADGVIGKLTLAALVKGSMPKDEPTESAFDFAFNFVLGNEGGYSNHPADRGGPTNWGIIQSRYSEYLGRPASVADVKAMTKDTAKAIYKRYYWNTLNLDGVNNMKVATAIFDQGVNRGTGTIARAVQKIVKVTADGEIGPKSLKAINAQDPSQLVNKIADNAEAAYRAIVAKNPSQQVFLKGWLRRAAHVRSLA